MGFFIRKICVLFFCLNLCSGCDFVYGVLQKEGAQEKKILGDVTPSVYSENVEHAQKLLRIHGCNPGAIDGKLGAKMREAIAGFQAKKSLPVTRFIDEKTWEALNVFTATGLVKNGEVDLAFVQKILRGGNFYSGKIDGKPGPKTTKAVKDFQQAHGLVPDGRIGPQTLARLNEVFLGSP